MILPHVGRVSVAVLLVSACASVSAQRDSKDTINSIGRPKTKVTKTAAKTSRKPPTAAGSRKSGVVRRSPPTRPSSSTKAVVKAPPKTTAPVTTAPTPAQTNRFVVSAIGKADARTISGALGLAKPGAEIIVKPGIYRESLMISIPVTIEAEEDARFDPPVIESIGGPCIVSDAEKATVTGVNFRFKGSPEDAPGQLINVIAGKLTVERSEMTGAPKTFVQVRGDKASVLIHKCTIRSEGGPTITFIEGATGTVEGCTLSGGRPAVVSINSGADAVVRECKVQNGPETGILWKDARGLAQDCEVERIFQGGIVAHGKSDVRVVGGSSRDAIDGVSSDNGAHMVLEGIEIHHTVNGGAIVLNNSYLEVKNCVIHDTAKMNGLHADTGSTLRVEGGEIYNTGYSGIWCGTKSRVRAYNVNIHDTHWDGVSLQDSEEGIVDGCTMRAIGFNGVGINCPKATIKKCDISGAKQAGIWLSAGGRATIDSCVITGNALRGINATKPNTATVINSRIQ